MEVTNYIFTAIFIVEAALKLFAYGRSYFDTAWNRFDFFVVISSIFDIGLKFLPTASADDVRPAFERRDYEEGHHSF